MKRKHTPANEIPWNNEPENLKLEEYFKYFDMGNLSDSAAVNKNSSALYISAYNDLNRAIENNVTNDSAELILFESSSLRKSLFSAYVVPYDLPDISIQSGDYLILDISKKCFEGNGLYVVNTSGVLNIKYIPASDETDFLIIEAKVCEIRRKL